MAGSTLLNRANTWPRLILIACEALIAMRPPCKRETARASRGYRLQLSPLNSMARDTPFKRNDVGSSPTEGTKLRKVARAVIGRFAKPEPWATERRFDPYTFRHTWKRKPIGDGTRFEPGRGIVCPWKFDSIPLPPNYVPVFLGTIGLQTLKGWFKSIRVRHIKLSN